MSYEIHTDVIEGQGYLSEAEAVRAAMESNLPNAEIVWTPEKEVLGIAKNLADELEIS